MNFYESLWSNVCGIWIKIWINSFNKSFQRCHLQNVGHFGLTDAMSHFQDDYMFDRGPDVPSIRSVLSCHGQTPRKRTPGITETRGMSLQWCHDGHDGISNHQPLDCLLNRLFRRRSKKTSKLRKFFWVCFAGRFENNDLRVWYVIHIWTV